MSKRHIDGTSHLRAKRLKIDDVALYGKGDGDIYMQADGEETETQLGDVSGPDASVTHHAVVRFDGTDGNDIKGTNLATSVDGNDLTVPGVLYCPQLDHEGTMVLGQTDATKLEVGSSGMTIQLKGDVVLDRDLTVNGTTTTVNTTQLEVEDSTIHAAHNNNADTIDSAYYMEYHDGTSAKYAGLVRDASQNGEFHLVKDLSAAPAAGTDYATELTAATLHTGHLYTSTITPSAWQSSVGISGNMTVADTLSSAGITVGGDGINAVVGNLALGTNTSEITIGHEAAQTNINGDVTLSGGAFSLPSLTAAQRNALTPVEGTLIYNTTSNALNMFSSSIWKTLGSGTDIPLRLRVLVVGGGGGGGSDNAGGGGAGELYETSYDLTPGNNLTITVGDGGAGGYTNQRGTNGQNSVFDTITMIGGGGGGAGSNSIYDGLAGGSGGGGGGEGPAGSGGSSTKTIGHGNAGGAADTHAGGGGGGAGGAGSDAVSFLRGGEGGDGMQSDITGVLSWYAAGGEGGNENNIQSSNGAKNGIGGYTNTSNTAAFPGAANTGSGGGGRTHFSNGYGGDGGSGVVIVRIHGQTHRLIWTGTLTGDVPSGSDGTVVGDDWYYRFTGGSASDVSFVEV